MVGGEKIWKQANLPYMCSLRTMWSLQKYTFSGKGKGNGERGRVLPAHRDYLYMKMNFNKASIHSDIRELTQQVMCQK